MKHLGLPIRNQITIAGLGQHILGILLSTAIAYFLIAIIFGFVGFSEPWA